MIEDDILSALQKGVIAAVAASITPALPVKYIGRTWTIPDDQKWLELVFIPNNSEDCWGDEQTHMGMFRFILHWPNQDAGAYEPLRVIRSIASYFVKGQRLQNVQIYAKPALTGLVEDGSEMLFPASLRYITFEQ